jgi:SNF2 family DNA or RNA helicase
MANSRQSIEERMNLFKKYLDHTGMDHKDYQYEGVRWILSNELVVKPLCGVRGGFIADEMGLGKTIMMIGTFLCNFVERTLIVVPPVLIDQWYLQIYKTTGHKSLIYHGTDKKNITLEQLSKATIVITTYGALYKINETSVKNNEITLLHKINWSRLVFDEAHHLRNKKTTRFYASKLLSIKSQIVWLVSGTPVQNKKADFYSLCSILKLPASFYTEAENLRQLALAFILKRTKSQIGIEMPDIISEKNMVAWKNRTEMELSEEIHSALSFSRVSSTKSSKPIVNAMKSRGVLQLLLNARQSCIYPKLMANRVKNLSDFGLYKDAFNSSSKLDFVIKTILERKANGCGKLIFCHFREEIDEIASRLRAGGMTNVATFDGRTSNAKRFEVLSNKNEVLILQIQTGCEGLNLQENYSEIYFVSPHWNPAIEDQAIARCHRIGQSKEVFVHRFEMCNFPSDEDFEIKIDTVTVDKYVGTVQDSKRVIAEECIQV